MLTVFEHEVAFHIVLAIELHSAFRAWEPLELVSVYSIIVANHE